MERRKEISPNIFELKKILTALYNGKVNDKKKQRKATLNNNQVVVQKTCKTFDKKRYLWCANLFNPNIWHFTLPQQSPLHFLFYCKVRRKGIISQKCEISTIELGGRLGGTWAAGRTPRENFLSPTLASFCAPPGLTLHCCLFRSCFVWRGKIPRRGRTYRSPGGGDT